MDFPTDFKDWGRFEKNNKNIALNIFSAYESRKEINNIRVSKFNRNRRHKVVLLIPRDGDKWHFTCVRNESRLFRNVFSSNNGDFYCLNCRQACRTDNALKKHERLRLNNKDCHVKLPKVGKNILKYEKDTRSLKSPDLVYADLENLLRNINDNSKEIDEDKSYQIKTNISVPSGYSMHLVRSYDENMITHYRGIDCMEIFVRAIKSITMMIGKTKQAKHKKLSDDEKYEFNRSEKCFVCKKELKDEKD